MAASDSTYCGLEDSIKKNAKGVKIIKRTVSSVLVLTDFPSGQFGKSRTALAEQFYEILYKKSFNLKNSWHEVYYTASSLQVILNNSCSKLHCQKFLKLKLFSYRIGPESRQPSSGLATPKAGKARDCCWKGERDLFSHHQPSQVKLFEPFRFIPSSASVYLGSPIW